MKFKSLLAASALALSVASTAHAADIVVPTTVSVAPAFSWTGFYAGAQLGYGWNNDKNKASYGYTIPNPDYTKPQEKANDTTSPTLDKVATSDHNLNSNGIMGGLYAGFNMDVADSVIVGVETDFAWSNAHKDFTQGYDKDYKATDKVDDIKYTYSDKSKVKWNGATRVRVGYGVDRILPYVAAGVAYAGVNTETSVTEKGVTEAISENSKDASMIGWTIGAGVDYAAMDNVILRLEYRYNNYGKKDFNNDKLTNKKTLSSNDLRVGVAYKF